MEIDLSFVNKQLQAYNHRDLETFCACYSPHVQVLVFPTGTPKADFTHQTFRERYQKLFEQSPELHCKVISRMIKGNFIIDEEEVTGMYGKKEPIQALAIYEVSEKWIERVWFVE